MRNRKPNRMPGCDYSLPGYYFVTINVHNRERVFGKILNGKMVLNGYGRIAAARWLWLYRRYSFLTLDAYVIMPDHVHGIVVIHDMVRDIPGCCVCRYRRDNSRVVLTCESCTCGKCRAGAMFHAGGEMIHDTLCDVTGYGVCRDCKDNSGVVFRWQRSYHDRIIRSRDVLCKARDSSPQTAQPVP